MPFLLQSLFKPCHVILIVIGGALTIASETWKHLSLRLFLWRHCEITGVSFLTVLGVLLLVPMRESRGGLNFSIVYFFFNVSIRFLHWTSVFLRLTPFWQLVTVSATFSQSFWRTSPLLRLGNGYPRLRLMSEAPSFQQSSRPPLRDHVVADEGYFGS